jgi:hypothetical protein
VIRKLESGAGIHASGKTAAIDSNVVGRCGGPGIIAETLQAASVTHNTSYLNRGSGIVTASYSLSHNVSFGNKGYGLEWGGGSQDRGCNDWFANESGAVKGGTPDPTDVAIDPLFCDIVADDVRLRADSPLLDAPGCGLIGALGMGCEAVASILPSSHEGDLGLVAYPLPARGGVQLSWKPLGVPGRIEIFDVSGALRWAGDVQSGSTGVRLPADGKPITSGAYFARLSRGGVAATAKVVLVGH